MKNRFWFAAALLLFPVAASAQVIFSEIMYDAPEPGGDTGREWVEIQNIGSVAVDISAWKLFEGDTNHKLVIAQGNTVLPPLGFAIIADKPEKFLSEHVGFSGTLFDSAFSLNNSSGEKLVLKNASSSVMSEVSYLPSWGAKGDGNSVQYFADGWSAAVPTPGVVNIKSVPKPISIPNPPAQTKISPPAPKKVFVTEKKPVVEGTDISTSSKTTAISVSASNDQRPFMWWFLLGGVIVVASLAYWIGGRKDPEDYEIIEDIYE